MKVTEEMKIQWNKEMKKKRVADRQKCPLLVDVPEILLQYDSSTERNEGPESIITATTKIENDDETMWNQLPTEIKESLGGQMKRSTTPDVQGWIRAIQMSQQVNQTASSNKGNFFASILDEEREFAAAKTPFVREADDKEVRNLFAMGVLEEVNEIPPWTRTIPSKMVRKLKIGTGLGLEVGKAEPKSRLVLVDIAKRPHPKMTDPAGPHANFIPKAFAPTSSAKAKRIFFLIVSALGIRILGQCDIVSAFCNSRVEEWIYIYTSIHPAVRKFVKETTTALRLKKYLYGCRYSPARWFECFMEVLHEAGYRSLGTAFDPCLLFKSLGDGKIAVICLHTDDLLHFSQCEGEWERLMTAINARFQCRSRVIDGTKETLEFCGIEAKMNNSGGWSIGQEAYIKRALIELNIHGDKKKGGRQLPDGLPVSKEDNAENEHEVEALAKEFGFRYDQAEGMLIHLLQTRFDLDFTIRQLARYTKMPGRRHFEAMRYFLEYIQAHTDAYLCFNGPDAQSTSDKINAMISASPAYDISAKLVKVGGEIVQGYCDSEFNGHPDHRSVSSHVIYIYGSPIETTSEVSTTISKQTMGAEANAMSRAQDKMIYYIALLERLDNILGGNSIFKPGKYAIYGDNESVIKAVENSDTIPTVHAPDHIKLKLAAVAEARFNGDATIGYVNTKYNPSDMGTKTLPGHTNAQCSALVMNDKHDVFVRKKKKL